MNKFILLFLFLSFNCFAEDTVTYKCNVLVQGNYTSGNYNNYSIGSKLNFTVHINNNYLDVLLSQKYTEIGTIVNNNVEYFLKENEKYSNISFSYIENKYKIICFSELEQSYLRKTNFRIDLGLGLGIKLIKTNSNYLEISEVLLPEHDDYYISNLYSLRYSTRLKFMYNKFPFNLTEIFLFQPNIYNSENVQYTDNLNARNNINFDVIVFKNISIGIADDYIYQSYIHYLYNNKQKFDNLTTFYIKFNIK